jgi:FKBP-type peptidyl-prolyl cis-trans isomerase
VQAVFIGSGRFGKSTGRTSFTVSQPAYTTLSDGVKIATIAPGSGPQIQDGQTASVFYTGYLEKNGEVFDDSINDGGTPLSYTVGAGQVIPGFDAGTAGMQVGETRIVEIPPAEAYGDTANGPIPANSTLIFVLTLESIS